MGGGLGGPRGLRAVCERGNTCDTQYLHFLDRPSSATWKRRRVENGSLILIRVTEWAYGQSRIGNVLHRSKTKKVLRWLPTYIALMKLVSRKIDCMLCTFI